MGWSFFDRYGQLRRAAPGLTSVVNPQATIYHNVVQSFANAFQGPVLLNSVLVTSDAGMTATPNQITITRAGRYLVQGNLAWALTGGAGLRQVYVYNAISGETIAAAEVAAAGAGGDTQLSCSGSVQCNAGDIIKMGAQQQSGAALNIDAAAASSPFQCGLSVTKIDGAVASYAPSPGPITASAFAGGPPLAPVDGQIWIALAVDANGTCWQFRYNAGSASAFKWEFIGGPPLTANAGGITIAGTSTWTRMLASTLARAGEYLIQGLWFGTANAGAPTWQIGHSTNNTPPGGGTAVVYTPTSAQALEVIDGLLPMVVTAGGTLETWYWANVGTGANASVYHQIIPRRIS